MYSQSQRPPFIYLDFSQNDHYVQVVEFQEKHKEEESQKADSFEKLKASFSKRMETVIKANHFLIFS